MWVLKCVPLLLMMLMAELGTGRPGGKVIPKDMMPGHERGGLLTKRKEGSLSRHYRHVQQPLNLEQVYKLPDAAIDNELGPFESNRLVLGNPDTTILQRRTGRVDEPETDRRSGRVPRMVFSTRFEYGEQSRIKRGALHYSAGSWAVQNVRRPGGVANREEHYRREKRLDFH